MTGSIPEDQLTLRRSPDADGVVVILEGELDLATAPQLERALREVQATSPGRILIDLRDLGFMDSTGLAVIVRAQLAADTSGHRLALGHPPPQVKRLLQITGLVDLFTFEDPD
jgi:anti-sigma B factor antagonist